MLQRSAVADGARTRTRDTGGHGVELRRVCRRLRRSACERRRHADLSRTGTSDRRLDIPPTVTRSKRCSRHSTCAASHAVLRAEPVRIERRERDGRTDSTSVQHPASIPQPAALPRCTASAAAFAAATAATHARASSAHAGADPAGGFGQPADVPRSATTADAVAATSAAAGAPACESCRSTHRWRHRRGDPLRRSSPSAGAIAIDATRQAVRSAVTR